MQIPPEDVKERAVFLWASTEMSASEIGVELDLTKNRVIGYATRAGRAVGLPHRPYMQAAWAATSHEEGDTMITRLSRGIGVPRKPYVYVRPPKKVAIAPTVSDKKRLLRLQTPSRMAPIHITQAYDLDQIGAKIEGKTSILEVKHGECRAVLGEHPHTPGGFYCAAEVKPKSSYCAMHHALFYVPLKRTARVRGKLSTFTLRNLGARVRV